MPVLGYHKFSARGRSTPRRSGTGADECLAPLFNSGLEEPRPCGGASPCAPLSGTVIQKSPKLCPCYEGLQSGTFSHVWHGVQ